MWGQKLTFYGERMMRSLLYEGKEKIHNRAFTSEKENNLSYIK